MLKVGNYGDVGTAEISDMLFTSKGALPGLVMVEWNMAADSQGSVSLGHFLTLSSLPNFLLFEDDLQKRNRIGCLYLQGLAKLGLGLHEQAERSFREVLHLDASHLAAEYELRQLRSLPARPQS